MANVATLNAAAVSDYSSVSPAVTATLWDRALHKGVEEQDVLSLLEGPPGSGKAIWRRDDLSKGGGDQINFLVKSPLVSDGQRGNSTLRGNEEKQNIGTYSLIVDFTRHATAVDKRFTRFRAAQVASDPDLRAELNEDVASWAGRMRQRDGLMRLIKDAAYSTTGMANNLLRSGGGAADASIGPSNVFDSSVFRMAYEMMRKLGANPINLAASKNPLSGDRKFMWLVSSRMLSGLANDSAWINANLARISNPNERDNVLFSRIYSGKELNGCVILEVDTPDHDNPNNGAIGSPLEPRALLRSATTDFTDTTLQGGGSGATASLDFWKDFAGFDYAFRSGQSAVADTNTYYVKIKDASGATSNAGGWEVCSYVGSTGNSDGTTLTVTRNVLTYPGSGGAAHDGAHDAGSLIVPCTADGTEIGHALLVGAGAMFRGYGGSKEKLVLQEDDYEMMNGVGIQSIYGQATCERADAKFRSVIAARCAFPA